MNYGLGGKISLHSDALDIPEAIKNYFNSGFFPLRGYPPLNGKSAKLFRNFFPKRAKNDVFLH